MTVYLEIGRKQDWGMTNKVKNNNKLDYYPYKASPLGFYKIIATAISHIIDRRNDRGIYWPYIPPRKNPIGITRILEGRLLAFISLHPGIFHLCAHDCAYLLLLIDDALLMKTCVDDVTMTIGPGNFHVRS